MWFTEFGGNRIGEISTTGVVTEYSSRLSSGSEPFDIALGPDGNLWFTEYSGNNIGEITPGGAITEFHVPTAAAEPEGIAVGSDGNIWFTESATSKVGRLTTSGAFLEYTTFGGAGSPVGIAAGPDGNLWMTDGSHEVESIGADAPTALIAAPVISGSLEFSTPESCSGDRWANWAGEQPTSPRYEWTLGGVAIPGATAQTYTPTVGELGSSLACIVSVTYGLLSVTVQATSAPVTISSPVAGAAGSNGQTGAVGSAGAAGATGSAGTAGAKGATGAKGSTGKVELVSCQVKLTTVTAGGKPVKVSETVCTTKVVTHPVTFTSKAVVVALIRANVVVARGERARVGKRTEIVLPAKLLRAGRYVMRLSEGGKFKRSVIDVA
jgi:hypothetical protein